MDFDTPTASRLFGDIWHRFDAVERRLSAPLTERMLDLGTVEAGMRVLDVATGRGEPALAAARRIQPDGLVLGVDIDQSVLRLARERADRHGITNLALAVSDAQTLDVVPTGAFDVALCRWGLMYFSRPWQALHSVRKSLIAGGSLVVAVWTDPSSASFDTLPRLALSKLRPLPPTVADSPGPFFYSEFDRLCRDVESAGFQIRHSEVIDVDVMEARTDAQLIDWCRSIGIPRLLQDVPADLQRIWERELSSAAEPYRRDNGAVRLGGRSLVVVAA